MISEETREKLRKSHLGKKQTPESIEKRRQKMLGRKFSDESRAKMSFYAKNRSKAHLEKLSLANIGENGSNWQGGKSSISERMRKRGKMIRWKKDILERDGFKCVICFNSDKELHADHIKPFSIFPELGLDIDNGRTLCIDCHRKTDTYGVKSVHLKKKYGAILDKYPVSVPSYTEKNEVPSMSIMDSRTVH